MGNLLGSPNTEKETHTGSTPEGLQFGVSSMQGWRVHMEDAHVTEVNLYAADKETKMHVPGHGLFGVFDGHGGTYAAFYSGNNIARVLSQQPKFIDYAKHEQDRSEKEKSFTAPQEKEEYLQAGVDLLKQALRDAFIEIDREIALALRGQKVADADKSYNGDGSTVNSLSNRKANSSDEEDAIRLLQEEGDSGTTACVVLVAPEFVICANAGDSRSVMSKQGGQVKELSFDHKPDDEDEEKRIRAAGGYVAGGRVEGTHGRCRLFSYFSLSISPDELPHSSLILKGDLAVSRGLGDFRFKSMEVVLASEDDLRRLEGSQALVTKPDDHKVTPVPDIIVQKRDASSDEFIIIACDGVWDVNTNEECIRMVAELFEEGESDVGLICEEVGRSRERTMR